jgi:hypothetical protein
MFLVLAPQGQYESQRLTRYGSGCIGPPAERLVVAYPLRGPASFRRALPGHYTHNGRVRQLAERQVPKTLW